jgi:hypothetical protein
MIMIRVLVAVSALLVYRRDGIIGRPSVGAVDSRYVII